MSNPPTTIIDQIKITISVIGLISIIKTKNFWYNFSKRIYNGDRRIKMFRVRNKNIYLNRGDAITLQLVNNEGKFEAGDTITLQNKEKWTIIDIFWSNLWFICVSNMIDLVI